MKKVVMGFVGLVVAMSFVTEVYATYILTNETHMFGAGAKSNTIGGETFPTSYRVMMDYTTPTAGDIDITAFIEEKGFVFWSLAFSYNYHISGYADGGRDTRWASRSGKETRMYWQKIDTTLSSNYIVGAYQY